MSKVLTPSATEKAGDYKVKDISLAEWGRKEITIAERLHEAGYATASIGKWHLGGPEYYPEHHGFDLNIAGTDQPQPRPGYFAPYAIDTIKQGFDRIRGRKPKR